MTEINYAIHWIVIYLLDSATQRLNNRAQINHYPADSVIDFRNTYPLDSYLSGG